MENKISVLIIAKNNEEIIGEAIKSVKGLADELIVIDGGSTDGTRRVSQKLGARVAEAKFKNFADQRNFAATLAHNKWIFYIDSDERATPEFILELKKRLKGIDDNTAGFYIRRRTFFLGRDWNFTDRIQRVFRRDKLKGWHGVVHETPEVAGFLEEVREPILHYTHRNLEQMVEKTNEWSEFEADLRLKSGHPKMTHWRFFRVIITGFSASYFKGGGWRNGTAGIIEAIFQAYSMFITYAKLWEKQRND